MIRAGSELSDSSELTLGITVQQKIYHVYIYIYMYMYIYIYCEIVDTPNTTPVGG